MIGRVVSAKMNKTVTVLVERTAMHPLYRKTYLQTKRYLVDAPMSLKEGDMVEIVKVKPISKQKHWQVTKVVGKSLVEIAEEQLKAEAEGVIAEVMPEEKKETQVERQESVEEVKKSKVKSKKSKVKTGKEEASH
mgnify:CR=1 FL=1